jgi:hypothetical protein
MITEEQWLAVRTILGSRAAFAEANATGFAALTDEQRVALVKGLRARGRGTDAMRVRHGVTIP